MSSEIKSKTGTIFYASPLIFAAACGLLALIIAVFALNNYQREKKLMGASLKREATAILGLVSASSRGAQRRGFMRGEISEENVIQSITQVIENSSEYPGLLALYLVDKQGLVRAHSNASYVGEKADVNTKDILENLTKEDSRDVAGIIQPTEGSEAFYRMSVIYHNAGFKDLLPTQLRGRIGRMKDPRLSPDHMNMMPEFSANPYLLVVELSLDEYNSAVRKQLLQIVILSVVLLLVGIGGLLSLILVQTFKGSQLRLKTMSTFTDTLVSSLPVGLIATAPNGEIRTCNRSAIQMLNLDQLKSVGKRLDDVLDKQIVSLLNNGNDEKTYHWDIRLPAESGDAKSLHVTKLAIEDKARVNQGIMLLVQDLSQLRELEDQLQRAERDAVVGRMAAGVAHELRNPLSSIKGLALLLKSKIEQDSLSLQTADLLVDEVERLNRSISELLDYARPAKLEVRNLEIDELLAKAVMLVRSDAEAGSIVIEENYYCGACQIMGDEDKLTQVMLNLCLNSIQAMADGGTLNISTSMEEKWAVVEIADNGSGIAPDITSKIFEPYFTTKHGGTGLGLAMSAKIIDDHKGQIQISSDQGRGTTVSVKLPLY